MLWLVRHEAENTGRLAQCLGPTQPGPKLSATASQVSIHSALADSGGPKRSRPFQPPSAPIKTPHASHNARGWRTNTSRENNVCTLNVA
jgi:hypothetical protein